MIDRDDDVPERDDGFHLRQMQVSLDTYQDRLLLRFCIGESDEVSIIVTRRFLSGFWRPLAAMIELPVEVTRSDNEGESVPGSAAEPPPESSNPSYPLGREPLLAAEFSLDHGEDDTIVLWLREPRARQFCIHLDNQAVQMLAAMLKAAAEAAQWGLDLPMVNSPIKPQNAGMLAPSAKHVLH